MEKMTKIESKVVGQVLRRAAELNIELIDIENLPIDEAVAVLRCALFMFEETLAERASKSTLEAACELALEAFRENQKRTDD